MKTLTKKDIKLGSIWKREIFAKNEVGRIVYKISKMNKKQDLVRLTIVEKSENICSCGCSDVGTDYDYDFDYLLSLFTPVYTVEGFEV